jgi:hypothetical protein
VDVEHQVRQLARDMGINEEEALMEAGLVTKDVRMAEYS